MFDSCQGLDTRLSVLQSVQTGSGADLAFYQMDTGDCFSGIKRPEREADQLPPSVTDVRNEESYTSTTTYILPPSMVWCVTNRYPVRP